MGVYTAQTFLLFPSPVYLSSFSGTWGSPWSQLTRPWWLTASGVLLCASLPSVRLYLWNFRFQPPACFCLVACPATLGPWGLFLCSPGESCVRCLICRCFLLVSGFIFYVLDSVFWRVRYLSWWRQMSWFWSFRLHAFGILAKVKAFRILSLSLSFFFFPFGCFESLALTFKYNMM